MPNGNDSVIGAVREWFAASPVIQNYGVNVDYLPNEPSYSIEVIPGDPVYKRYVDGGAMYQLNFAFTANMGSDGDPRTMTANEDFFQDLLNWVSEQDAKKAYPEIEGRKTVKIQTTSSGYLYNEGGDLSAYQAQFRLIYL